MLHYFNNKVQYHHFKQQSRLLISSHADISDIGWLFQAAFFYRHKRYHIVLELISHILSRTIKADGSPSYITRIPAYTDSAMDILRCLFSLHMTFEIGSSLIPDELEIEVTDNVFIVDAIIMTHFLKFLSNYHLEDIMSCMESLQSLGANAETWYRHSIVGKTQIASAFLCLGVAHRMMGYLYKAHECFSICVSQGKWNCTKAAFDYQIFMHSIVKVSRQSATQKMFADTH